jgi:hemerythrin-like domain-containing protein
MQPAEGVRFIHTAIMREARDLEAAARDAKSADDLRAIADRLRFFTHVNHLHTQGEEVGPFAALEERLPHVRDAYVFDHAEEKKLTGNLERELEKCIGAGKPSPELVRATVAFTTHVELHATKENESLVPLITKTFSPAEQGVHVGKMMAGFSPADLQKILPWMFRWLDPADRVAYRSMLEKVMPPERFTVAMGWVRAGVSDEIWSEIAAR